MLQLLLFSLIASSQAEIRIGDLSNNYPSSYKTGGEVLVRDEKTIIGRDHVQVNWKHKSIGNISQLETRPLID